MTPRTILYLRIALGVIAVLFAFRIYRIIMEPIEFQKIKDRRYEAVIMQLEQLREAQLAFKNEYGMYASEVSTLVDFIKNAEVTIVERKDSSFMQYNKVYQIDMNKDTIIYRVIGSAPGHRVRRPHPDGLLTCSRRGPRLWSSTGLASPGICCHRSSRI